MKRKLKWLAIVVAVSLLGFGTALFLWPRDRITVESWQKIRIGMTEDEVAEILGGPGMSYEEYVAQRKGKPPLIAVFSEGAGVRFIVIAKERCWIGHRGCIEIHFNSEGHVAYKFFYPLRSAELSLLDRLHNWLGW